MRPLPAKSTTVMDSRNLFCVIVPEFQAGDIVLAMNTSLLICAGTGLVDMGLLNGITCR